MEYRRGRLEIARDILMVAKTGAKPTELVYKANLNFNVIKKYLPEMEEAGLIEVEVINHGKKETRLYTTTGRGFEFLSSLERTLAMYKRMIYPLRPQEQIQESPVDHIAREG